MSGVDRRSLLQGAVLAITSLCTDVFGKGNQTGPSASKKNEIVTYLNAAELRHIIESSPEAKTGHAGLLETRLPVHSDYPIIGIRRSEITSSEVHADFTDVWFIVDGSGTLITGGTIVGGIEKPAGEVRGKSIKDGNTKELRPGDLVVIPAGVPHWVNHIKEKELLYFVVKVPRKR